ncbi:hypothetical protein NDJ00_23935 [Vibrio parahaemolyticus]|uniref:hypothetical protein n=1 Tax=Vibrio harveyi group TaxID=717610 RepID=UPI0006C485F8|nr:MULTISPECIES: hypothetical protein [Vibrio harveyi group]KOY41181.1 hypothetical protein ACX10_02425 [Vibrio parahaemolyticus]MCS0117233.1 hypothetical protein [Vibrio parahaemolyticus]MCS0310789.1 hypothetical protein [Vibrio diabolicus]
MIHQDSNVFINDDQVIVLKAEPILSDKRTNRIVCTAGLVDNKNVVVLEISTSEGESVFTYLDSKGAVGFANHLLDASLKSTLCEEFDRHKVETLYLKKEAITIECCDVSKIKGSSSYGVSVSIHKASFPVKDNRVVSCDLSPKKAVDLVGMIQQAIEAIEEDALAEHR